MISAELKLRPITLSASWKKSLELKPFTAPQRFGLLLVSHWRDPSMLHFFAVDEDGKEILDQDLETTIVSEHVAERAVDCMTTLEGMETLRAYSSLAHWLYETMSSEFPRHFNSVVRVEEHSNEWDSMLHDYKESVRVMANIGNVMRENKLSYAESLTDPATVVRVLMPRHDFTALPQEHNPHIVTAKQISLGDSDDFQELQF